MKTSEMNAPEPQFSSSTSAGMIEATGEIPVRPRPVRPLAIEGMDSPGERPDVQKVFPLAHHRTTDPPGAVDSLTRSHEASLNKPPKKANPSKGGDAKLRAYDRIAVMAAGLPEHFGANARYLEGQR